MTSESTAPGSVETSATESLDEVGLFQPGSQEHWFDAYRILH